MFIKVNARINIPTKASKNVNMQTLITVFIFISPRKKF